MPESFRTLSTEKYKSDKSSITKEDKRKIRKVKDNFYLTSNFAIDQLLLSGKVLYNDPVGKYVNAVASNILNEYPELDKKVEIYVVKSTEVNAFATQGGVIFVTLGLLSRLENEAQLAFILAHEIAHVKKNHVMNSAIEDNYISRGKDDYRGLSIEDRLLARSNFSKNNELEADSVGLELLRHTKYDFSQINSAFTVLEYSHTPFINEEFDTDFFNSDAFTIPDSLFLDTVTTIARESASDSLGTHPDIDKRKEQINNILSKSEIEKGQKFIHDESSFYEAQKNSRYELCRIFLKRFNSIECFYSAYALKKIYKDDPYLDLLMAKSIYQYSKLRNHMTNGNPFASSVKASELTLADYKKIQGNSQHLYYLFDQLNSTEINLLTSNFLWELKEKYPDNMLIVKYAKNAISSLVRDHGLLKEDFLSDTTYISKTKFNHVNTHFDSYFDTETIFASIWDLEEEKYKKEKAHVKSKEELKAEKKELKQQQKKGYALGIDKIVVANPNFISYKLRRRDFEVNYIESEYKKIRLGNYYQENAKLLGLDIDVIEPKNYEKNSTKEFNNLSFLDEIITEWSYSYKMNNYISVYDDEVRDLINQYGTKYFLVSGVQLTSQRKKNTGYAIFGSIFYPLFLPMAIRNATKKLQHTKFLFALIDIESGEIKMLNTEDYILRDKPELLHSHIYSVLHQIKYKRR